MDVMGTKRKKMGKEATYLAITIPIVALFFLFNTLPLIQGVIYSFTNFKGYGDFDWVGEIQISDLPADPPIFQYQYCALHEELPDGL